VGLILDVAVVAIAVVVIGSLATLAWTLGVSAVAAVRRERVAVTQARERVADVEMRLRAAAAGATTTMGEAAARTRPVRPPSPASTIEPGEPTDR
jgi:hypothetical protein